MKQKYSAPKTFYIRTYGCQMNELDSEIMVGQLEKKGLKEVVKEEEADLLIFNTCSIRDLAERKVMGKIGQLARGAQKNAIIGVTGCMAMAKKESLFRKLPHVDFVLGTNNITELDSVLEQVIGGKTQVLKTDDHFEENLNYIGAKRQDPVKAYVSIIRGCDKYCTYCIVPYTRGQEFSRPYQDIIEECKHLAEKGYKEVTLLGQNVNSYGKDHPEWDFLFHDLLYELDKIEGLERIRFMTSHPVDITKNLMEAVRDLPSLCKFIHFPIQSGSNRILKKMHRIYTKEEYFEKVAMLKEHIPGVALGTDIIVGFPTETEEEFQETYEAMRAIQYGTAFIFSYSPRKGTPSTRWPDDIPEEVKNKRLQSLLSLQQTISSEQMQNQISSTVEVLVERQNERNPNFLQGRTTHWKNVLFEGDKMLVGTLQPIAIHGYTHQTLLGSIDKKLGQ